MKHNRDLYHIIFGLHSNIPICCIMEWIKGESKPEFNSVWYVRCEECRYENKVVKTHKCSRYNKDCAVISKLIPWNPLGV